SLAPSGLRGLREAAGLLEWLTSAHCFNRVLADTRTVTAARCQFLTTRSLSVVRMVVDSKNSEGRHSEAVSREKTRESETVAQSVEQRTFKRAAKTQENGIIPRKIAVF